MITNADGKLLGVLPKTPAGATWRTSIQNVTGRLNQARANCGKNPNEEHRRGGYATVTAGRSFGGGQTVSTQAGPAAAIATHTRVPGAYVPRGKDGEGEEGVEDPAWLSVGPGCREIRK